MQIRDQVSWDKWDAANRDGGYGEAVLDFAVDWANAMEESIAEGSELEDVAKSLSFKTAEGYGLTGFQYGAAVSMLSGCWKHGDRLRVWHNLDTQIHDEGEKANAAGGVLNPALMNITVKDEE